MSIATLAVVAALSAAQVPDARCALDPNQMLGRMIFFDTRLSEPAGQSCASCHGPAAGFAGPQSFVNATTGVYPGAVPERFGNRRPPTAAYATAAPPLSHDAASGVFAGGNFYDGRATGEKLGTPAEDQALGPFLNPVEHNNPDRAAVVSKVCDGPYGGLFLDVWGADACADVDAAYERIARSIAAFEASPAVSAYASRWDAARAGGAPLALAEERGRALFEGKAGCSSCHAGPELTTQGYANVGFPRNPMNPFYWQPQNLEGTSWVDPGLGGFLASRPEWAHLAPAHRGEHRIQTLRNVDARPGPGFVKSYGHNGFFKDLRAVVHFMNTRDALPRCAPGDDGAEVGTACWPAPEVEDGLSFAVGNLGLTAAEEEDLVAFLGALTDAPACGGMGGGGMGGGGMGGGGRGRR